LGLANRTPGNPATNVAALKFATTGVQFPVGLVASALSFAVLPMLSGHVRDNADARFKETLTMCIRLGLLLMIPAAAGLIALRGPITALLFEHRHYTAQDAALTAVVLQDYAYQLPFLVVDQLVMFAFYARKNTVVPVVVGFVCYGFYALVAFPFYATIGAPALAFANTAQNSMHGLILLALFYRFYGSLEVRASLPAILKIVIATVAMVAAIWVVQRVLAGDPLLSLRTLKGQFLTVLVTGTAAVIVYGGVISLLRVEETALLKRAVFAKLVGR
ncbi:MAG: murein biosynthesis integral membrane protein MurJ, partial [Acidimicrobiales bacterium]